MVNGDKHDTHLLLRAALQVLEPARKHRIGKGSWEGAVASAWLHGVPAGLESRWT